MPSRWKQLPSGTRTPRAAYGPTMSREPAAEGDEAPARRVRAAAVAAHMDEVRDVAGREPGEERLVVEAAHRVVDRAAEVADHRVRDVQPALGDVVAAAESVDVQRRIGRADARRLRRPRAGDPDRQNAQCRRDGEEE